MNNLTDEEKVLKFQGSLMIKILDKLRIKGKFLFQ